jgi:tetratricopeptide (TPR) repeat protein
LEWDVYAFLVLVFSWLVIPPLAFLDRVAFDGKRIRRTGLLPRTWSYLTSSRDRIKLNDIEQVQTNVLRTIRRGGNMIYTYRTAFFGKGKIFVIHSGNATYRRMVEAILPRLNETLLDPRSIELRDHIADRNEIRRKARAADIPPADILEGSLKETHGAKTSVYAQQPESESADSIEKALNLHRLANELRVSGLLPQSIEAFRRAVLLMPRNAKLLFDFALCLKSYAGSQRDGSVERRALAMMRLAERRAGDDGELLVQIGEGYFQFGEWRRAAAAFRKAIERAGERFKSMIGLAEIALHEGKIAHVIHNFSAASDLAETPAVKRWTKHEIDYFSRLNDDEEYMELEISRMNLLDTLEMIKRSALRIAVFGLPVIVIGILVEDDLIANLGWAVSMISLIVWVAVILLGNMLSSRIPYDLVEDE